MLPPDRVSFVGHSRVRTKAFPLEANLLANPFPARPPKHDAVGWTGGGESGAARNGKYLSPGDASVDVRMWTLFAAALIFFLVRWMRNRGVTWRQAAARTAQLMPAAFNLRPSPERLRHTLSENLHRLDTTIDAFAKSAAHAQELSDHPEFRKAVALLANPAVERSSVEAYALGQSWTLSCAALAALKQRTDGHETAPRVPDAMGEFSTWQIQFALQYLAALRPPLAAGAPLVGFRDWWSDNQVIIRAFASYFDDLDNDTSPELGDGVAALPAYTQGQIKEFLTRLNRPVAGILAGQIIVATPADEQSSPSFLASIGRFWTTERDQPLLLPVDDWKDSIASAERLVQRTPPRPLLVCGEAQVGKTSFLRLVAQRLESSGWTVFEASGADFQAGQQYIGQLEGRIRSAIEELHVEKKMIWYVPDLLTLALSGTHQGQSASMLDQILPAITAGRLIVWTEAPPSALARLLQLRPALRRIVEVVRLEPMEEDEATELAERLVEGLSKAQSAPIDRGVAATAIEVAQHYLTAAALPGSALSLIKTTALRADRSKGQRVTSQDILVTLAQQTGLPLDILDGSERIDLAAIRTFFSSRVIGQPEAVTSVVERIAMLKSGLNDPDKPIGVFLFAGPTGTGKTELAKAVADYLFGSVDRMIRLDMSEYQNADTISKILGGPGLPPDADTLISRVRKQPFSLVLLDEFEKSHPQIWDLFLQVFDEGRLSDAFGQTADYRHSLIILTTNLGATAHRNSGLGFAPSRGGFTNDQVMRTISQTFRPEFQNRLDKVIVFKPLTRELMRGILQKELKRVFERRGLKDRAWAVEWEASALEFLLEKGFSPEMGARPLKRAIDQFVIAPLAQTIVERRFPEGDQFVFVRSDGEAIQAEFVDPDDDLDDESETPSRDLANGAASATPPDIATMVLTPEGSSAEIAALAVSQAEITEKLASPQWSDLKASLSAEMNEADFWSKPDRFATLSRLELMDRVAVASETADSLLARLSRRRGHAGQNVRDLVGRLALQVHLVQEGLQDVTLAAPTEVAVLVEPAFSGHGPANDGDAMRIWRDEIAAMYFAWARRRNMHVSESIDLGGPSGPVRIVGGFGAYRTLAREMGLHVLEAGDTGGVGRITVRVLVVPPPAGHVPKQKLKQSLAERFARAPRSSVVVRRYRRTPAPLVRNADGSWRSGKLDAVLGGDFDLLSGASA